MLFPYALTTFVNVPSFPDVYFVFMIIISISYYCICYCTRLNIRVCHLFYNKEISDLGSPVRISHISVLVHSCSTKYSKTRAYVKMRTYSSKNRIHV